MTPDSLTRRTRSYDEIEHGAQNSSFPDKLKILLTYPIVRRILWLLCGCLFMYWIGGAMFWPLSTKIIGMAACVPVAILASDSFFGWKRPRSGIPVLLTLILFGYTLVQFLFSPSDRSPGIWGWVLTPFFAVASVFFVIPLLGIIQKGAKRKTLKNGRNVPSWRFARSVDKVLNGPLFWWACVLVAAVSMILMMRQAFSLDVWIDESFSMALIRHSYLEMIQLTAIDVHPPLFYLILKTGVSLLRLVLRSMNLIIAARLICLIPYFILYYVGYKDIRKYCGNFVAGIYIVALSFAPQLFEYSSEIRMYGFSMLWIQLLIVAILRLVKEGPSKKVWIELGCYSLCAAYTHYYAALLAGFCWLFILWWIGLNAKREDRLMALKIIGYCILGYAPWLFVLYRQLRKVSADYWIASIDANAFQSYFSFVLGSGFVLVACVFFMGILAKRKSPLKWKEVLSNWLIAMPFFIIACGLFVTFMVRPLYVNRYAFAAILPLILGVAFKSQTIRNPMIRLLLVCCMALAGLGQMSTSYQIMNHDRQMAASLIGTLNANFEDIPVEDTLIITDNTHTWRNLHEMVDYPIAAMPDIEFDEPISEPVYGSMPTVNAQDDILSLLDKKKTILFVFVDENDASYYRANEKLYIRQVKQQDYGSTFHELTIFTVELKNLE